MHSKVLLHMLSLLADVWNSIINVCFRDISPTLKGFLVLIFLVAAFWFLAKSINVGKNSAERPIFVGRFILFLLFFTLCILYAVL